MDGPDLSPLSVSHHNIRGQPHTVLHTPLELADNRRSLNLQCIGCRRRKIRCNRNIPTCSRCIDLHLTCNYPTRTRRQEGRTANRHIEPPLPSNHETSTQLNVILERLIEIERINRDLRSPAHSSDTEAIITADSFAERHHHTRRQEDQSHDPGKATNQPPSTSQSTPRLAFGPDTLPRNSPEMPQMDVIALLKAALDHVQTLRVQRISRLSTQANLNIPSPDVARSWIKTFFENPPVDMFLGFMDVKLIKLVPDLINMPDVTLKPAIHVLYHCILHYAACMPEHYGFQDENAEIDYPTLAYVGALRALPMWQREATGTKTDFAAAILMALTASEHFDIAMVWKLFQLASEYAEKLQLHSLDTNHVLDGQGTIVPDSATDDERRSLWDLIGKDLCCRLLCDKPPIISASLADWRVNLPWLGQYQPPNPSSTVPDILTMTFLLRSRLTLTLTQFFKILEEETSMERASGTIHDICQELVLIYDGWPISQSLQNNTHQQGTWWRLCEVSLDAYSSIMMMLCKSSQLGDGSSPATNHMASTLEKPIPTSQLMIDISRRLLTLVGDFLDIFSMPPTVSTVFAFYRCYLPIGCLARHAIECPDDPRSAEDTRTFEKISVGVAHAAEGHGDLKPLVLALEEMSRSLQHHLRQDN
ncbi:hypothetical protein LCI18_014083 [Fusarium solani-melongenae]|uniref:Uncharacterized protein n=1 Tax=Fusarium solani subsp. cucurbitae TaxID=2747967 RepID=A0ACD3ZP86_FUSSC|nr:hypothetical protein LCI18_014083 [Fusarium solani-melongenae]